MAPRNRRRLPPFEELIELHGEAVLRFCRARTGAEHAEDAFQETMLAALRAYDRVEQPDAILGWLFSIAARKTVDLHRQRSRQPAPVEDPEGLLPPGRDQLPERDIWELVRRLPRKQREAVTLRYLGDLTNREIAAVMHTSVEAARRSVFEGLRRLHAEVSLR